MGKARIVPNRENYNIARKEKERDWRELGNLLCHRYTEDLWSGHHMYLNPLRFAKKEIKEKLNGLLDEILIEMDRRYEYLRESNFFTRQGEDGKLKYKKR